MSSIANDALDGYTFGFQAAYALIGSIRQLETIKTHFKNLYSLFP